VIHHAASDASGMIASPGECCGLTRLRAVEQ
jgi:hypothetical protein